MNDRDVLKSLLQECVFPGPSAPISGEELMVMLRAKSTDIKVRVVRRLGKEVQAYLFLVAVTVGMLVLRYEISARTLVGVAVLALLGLPLAALLYKEHQIKSLPLQGTVRESLTALIAAIDSLTRLYFRAYMACLVAAVALWATFVAWHWGVGPGFFAVLVAVGAFLAWCYLSGRRYLERSFGRYRVDLVNCLRELAPESSETAETVWDL